jgi:hypothetical protein
LAAGAASSVILASTSFLGFVTVLIPDEPAIVLRKNTNSYVAIFPNEPRNLIQTKSNRISRGRGWPCCDHRVRRRDGVRHGMDLMRRHVHQIIDTKEVNRASGMDTKHVPPSKWFAQRGIRLVAASAAAWAHPSRSCSVRVRYK